MAWMQQLPSVRIIALRLMVVNRFGRRDELRYWICLRGAPWSFPSSLARLVPRAVRRDRQDADRQQREVRSINAGVICIIGANVLVFAQRMEGLRGELQRIPHVVPRLQAQRARFGWKSNPLRDLTLILEA
jgi:hypothetical protein